MSASDFQNNVSDVETAILTIAKVCNVENGMKQKLQDAKNRSLDPTLCIPYQNLLLHEKHKKSDIEEVSNSKNEKRTNFLLVLRTNIFIFNLFLIKFTHVWTV